MWICASMDHSFSLDRTPEMILSVLLFGHKVCLHLFAGIKTYAHLLEFLSSVCLEMEVTHSCIIYNFTSFSLFFLRSFNWLPNIPLY